MGCFVIEQGESRFAGEQSLRGVRKGQRQGQHGGCDEAVLLLNLNE